MALLILPGNHKDNASWAEQCRNACLSHCAEVVSVSYSHWEFETDSSINFDRELANLREITTHESAGRFNWVLCKSAGVALALMAIEQKILSPVGGILCGVPLNPDSSEWNEFLRLVSTAQSRFTFVQEMDDPICPADRLDAEIRASTVSCHIRTIPGNQHLYGDPELLSDILRTAMTGESQERSQFLF